MAADSSYQRKKDLAKIEALQDQLAEKEDEVERLEKEVKAKERQIQEVSSQTASKVSKVREECEEKVRAEQRRN
jgi:archaellum component FlaC